MLHIQDISETHGNPACSRTCQSVWKEKPLAESPPKRRSSLLNRLYRNKPSPDDLKLTAEFQCTAVMRQDNRFWY
jgi:hypothetical protein